MFCQTEGHSFDKLARKADHEPADLRRHFQKGRFGLTLDGDELRAAGSPPPGAAPRACALKDETSLLTGSRRVTLDGGAVDELDELVAAGSPPPGASDSLRLRVLDAVPVEVSDTPEPFAALTVVFVDNAETEGRAAPKIALEPFE